MHECTYIHAHTNAYIHTYIHGHVNKQQLQSAEWQQQGEECMNKAVQLGHAEAAYYMAMHHRERGNLDQMRIMVQKSADLGYAEANFFIGIAHFQALDGYVYVQYIYIYVCVCVCLHAEIC
jgi:hypothetical protein